MFIYFHYSSGPVISPAAKQRITGLIASAEEEGGVVVLDGRGLEVQGYPEGNWVGPTIIEATTDMRCYRSVTLTVLINVWYCGSLIISVCIAKKSSALC